MSPSQQLAGVLSLPPPDAIGVSKLSDPIGTGNLYSAPTVLRLLGELHRRCIEAAEDVMSECDSWESGGDHGSTGAMLVRDRIKAVPLAVDVDRPHVPQATPEG